MMQPETDATTAQATGLAAFARFVASRSGADHTAAAIALRDAIVAGCDGFDVVSSFVDVLTLAKRLPESWALTPALHRALKSRAVMSYRLVPLVAKIARQSPAVEQAFVLAAKADLQAFAAAFTPEFYAGLAQPLMLDLLRDTVIYGWDLEAVLTAARRKLLLDRAIDLDRRRFCIALAQQCMLNEFVFNIEPDEAAALADLIAAFAADLAADAATDPYPAALIACYRPLTDFAWSETLLKHAPDDAQDGFSGVVTRHIREPRRERELAAALPSFRTVERPTSLAVKAMYETNPYPRWASAVRSAPMPFRDTIRRRYPGADYRMLDDVRTPDILIPGCGTGQQILHAINGYERWNLTAIDLSRRSLAYAQRQMEHFAVPNVRFMEADILDFAESGETFDIIECTGVLHHMADPFAAWRGLTTLLRPGGVMHVALYSETARQGVAAARGYAQERGYEPTPDGLRAFRRDILNELQTTGLANASPAVRTLVKSPDFYALSPCRDLAFHIQEKCFHINEIADMIGALGLRFLGFGLPSAQTFVDYRNRWPDDPQCLSFANWAIYEAENPSVFASMYAVLVQKPLG